VLVVNWQCGQHCGLFVAEVTSPRHVAVLAVYTYTCVSHLWSVSCRRSV